MAPRSHHPFSTRCMRAIPHAVALALAAATAHAQTALAPVTVTGQGQPAADIAGFGDVPLRELPLSATVIDRRQIETSGARRLADLTRFDASMTDAYNAPGYWDFVTIRGFTLDSRFNYRREGLPITTETVIPLENKERVEILRGTSGIQAGTSAPGGLVNYVVKRPTESDLREARVEFTQRASTLGAVDLGGRFGADGAFGYRLNVAAERLRPQIRKLDGERSLLALATDWRIGRDSLLEAEFEWSRKTQPSQVGYSLLGSVLPAPPDPRLNLNNQPWVQPTRFEGLTGTLRFTQSLSPDWKWNMQLGTQRLRTDDYTAFPFGCGAEGNFDRFCSDGTVDYYDYRSENERRKEDVASIGLKGKLATGAVRHELAFGVLATRTRDRLPPNAYNFVGTGDVSGTVVLPPDPTLSYPGLIRNERSVEFSAQDAMRIGPSLSAWLGIRHSRLDRSSIATDASGETASTQSLTTPWAALSYKLAGSTLAYASWGQGVESQVVPNNGLYANAGATLPALKSRQWELGLKGGSQGWSWQAAWFDIHRPMSNVDYCNITFTPCVGQFDGEAHHRGLEASTQWSSGAWRIGAGATALHATREGSAIQPDANGKRPQNVPNFVARANAAWRVPGVTGLELLANVSHEGRRAVLQDESIMLPAWTRWDAALRYETQWSGHKTSLELGVDNVANKRAWKEAPFKFGHVYLYELAPRTWRASMTVAF